MQLVTPRDWRGQPRQVATAAWLTCAHSLLRVTDGPPASRCIPGKGYVCMRQLFLGAASACVAMGGGGL